MKVCVVHNFLQKTKNMQVHINIYYNSYLCTLSLRNSNRENYDFNYITLLQTLY